MTNFLDVTNLNNFNAIFKNDKFMTTNFNAIFKNDKFMDTNFNDNQRLNIDRYKREIIEYYNYELGNKSIINKFRNHISKYRNNVNNPYKFDQIINDDSIINIYDDIKSDLILRLTEIKKTLFSTQYDIIITIFLPNKYKKEFLTIIDMFNNLDNYNISFLIYFNNNIFNYLKKIIIDYINYYYKIDDINILKKRKEEYESNLNEYPLTELLNNYFCNIIVDNIRNIIIDFSLNEVLNKNKSQKFIDSNIEESIKHSIIGSNNLTILKMYKEYKTKYKKKYKFNTFEKKKIN